MQFSVVRILLVLQALLLSAQAGNSVVNLSHYDLMRVDFAAMKQEGIGILLSEQNLHFARLICDRAYIINEGLILEAGSPESIVKSETARAVSLGERFKL